MFVVTRSLRSRIEVVALGIEGVGGSAVRDEFVGIAVGGGSSSCPCSSDEAKDSMEIMLRPSIQEIRLAEWPDNRLTILDMRRQEK